MPSNRNTSADDSQIFDVAIVGQGLVGASLALLLDATGIRAVQVEARSFSAPSAAWGERFLALNACSVHSLQQLGALPDRGSCGQIESIHISRAGEFAQAKISAHQAGLSELGLVVPARLLALQLEQNLAATKHLHRINPASVTALAQHSDYVELELDHGQRTLRAEVVVGSDGSESTVRQLLGIATKNLDESAADARSAALVFNIKTERAHQGMAFERFTDAGPIALLPLPEQRMGAVWTLPLARAQALANDEPALKSAFQAAFGYRLGRILQMGPATLWPLHRLASIKTVQGRAVLVGNAAQTIHPIGAQGFNLGLRDAVALAQCLQQSRTPETLQAYDAMRKADRSATVQFSENLLRATRNASLPARMLRGAALQMLANAPFLQRDLIRFGLGFTRGQSV
jgi:2-octaprenyl-6-methoxyphenol hydroxylase